MNKHQAEIKKLAQNVTGVVTATSPAKVQGTGRFIYFQPYSAHSVNDVLDALTKIGMPAEMHLSSLNDKAFPMVRVPLTEAVVYGRGTGMSIDGLLSFLNSQWAESIEIDSKDVDSLAQNISNVQLVKYPAFQCLECALRNANAESKTMAIFKEYGLNPEKTPGKGAVAIRVFSFSRFEHSPDNQVMAVLCKKIQEKQREIAGKPVPSHTNGTKNNKAMDVNLLAKIKSWFNQNG